MKRDLHADLLLCESVRGVYYDEGGGYRVDYPDEGPRHYFEESREGWPEAIRRAIAAEAEVERLRDGITLLRDRLICDLDALESGDATERTVAYADCTESIIRRMDRYVSREVSADVEIYPK